MNQTTNHELNQASKQSNARSIRQQAKTSSTQQTIQKNSSKITQNTHPIKQATKQPVNKTNTQTRKPSLGRQ